MQANVPRRDSCRSTMHIQPKKRCLSADWQKTFVRKLKFVVT